MRTLSRIGALLFGITLLCAHTAAQCPLEWSSGSPQPQLSGLGGHSTLWDPDGAGPLPLRLVLGGEWLVAGDQPVHARVTTWDGTRWEALGTGPGTSGSVNGGLTVWNGQVVACGAFQGGGVNDIATWDGTAWQPLLPPFVSSNLSMPTVWNNDLYARVDGGVLGDFIKRLSGTTWTTLPNPPMATDINAMMVYQGTLCVGGRASAGVGVLERWNGTAWLPSITTDGSITALAVRPSLAVGGADILYAGGAFTHIGGTAAAYIASTTGGSTFSWSTIGTGLPSFCAGLHVRNVSLTGYTIVASTASLASPVMRYAVSPLGGGASWQPMGTEAILGITYFAGAYHGVTNAWPYTDNMCRRFDGTSWVPVRGPGLNGEVHAVAPSGAEMIVGGTFTSDGSNALNGVARWDGAAFHALGSGLTGASVEALLTLGNGDIVAGGSFATAGGTTVNHVARWNGTTWLPMGNGFDAPVYALCQLPNGDVIAGGAFTQVVGAPVLSNHVARWNGTSWSPMDFGMNDDVLALCVRGDGTLFAGGRFTVASTFSRYYVTQWTGSVWGQVGAAMNAPVHGLAARPNGDIVAVGEFTQASLQPVDRCARWNGSTWTSMGAGAGTPGPVHAVVALPNGDVIAGRGFHEPLYPIDLGISRWDGLGWSAVGVGLHSWDANPVTVRSMALNAAGELLVGGDFHIAGEVAAYQLARLTSTCPATAQAYGTGCSSAAGPLVLTADTLPWIGAPFATTTTGIDVDTLCLGLIGFTQLSIPLDSILFEGQPGCTLLTTPDIQLLMLPDGGAAHSSFALADDPSLIGVPFQQQTIPFEFDANGIAAIRASNALALVVGTL